MILRLLSTAYGTAAAQRRYWYARHPDRRRHLDRPVISVGSLRVGGSGKTPIVEYLARLLLEHGHHPAVLTRGYGRRKVRDGVTVVSDGAKIVTEAEAAGDEPLMLAQALPGVMVLVGADRYLSGSLAERRLGATVHLLDDGFQHLGLARDVDLLLAEAGDLTDVPLPGGHLREPLAAARAADAVLVGTGDDAEAERIGRLLGIGRSFRVRRQLGSPRALAGDCPPALAEGVRVFAFAAIARPERFFSDLSAEGWMVAGTLAFGDHHWFSRRDLVRVAAEAQAAGAGVVLTTEKDAARLHEEDLREFPIAAVPVAACVEPERGFHEWLIGQL